MTDLLPVHRSTETPPTRSEREQSARLVAQTLEATFLAEMLKAAGFGEQKNSFSGGSGETQFASFHRQAVAEKIAAAGGIGLAEHIMRSILEAEHDT